MEKIFNSVEFTAYFNEKSINVNASGVMKQKKKKNFNKIFLHFPTIYKDVILF